MKDNKWLHRIIGYLLVSNVLLAIADIVIILKG